MKQIATAPDGVALEIRKEEFVPAHLREDDVGVIPSYPEKSFGELRKIALDRFIARCEYMPEGDAPFSFRTAVIEWKTYP